ncbi:DUF4352 domain-containing protein [Bacillus solitudinis]|uniref:DUF4352 domain-containing protein n=1 Tax=Bacillus solitudinis TaxID=2014074 RepID=UPI000C24AD8A|nr:DUF4352 domain-containing protein [Bacillus solitudinis]
MKRKFFLLAVLSVCLFSIVIYLVMGKEIFRTEAGQEVTTHQQQEQLNGMTKEINQVYLTVNHIRTEPGETEATQFVIIDFSLENNRETVYEFSLFKLTLVDEDNYAYTSSSDIETKGILGGQLHPGRSNRGEVAFEVPIASNYELVYTDHLRTGQVIWDIHVSN